MLSQQSNVSNNNAVEGGGLPRMNRPISQDKLWAQSTRNFFQFIDQRSLKVISPPK